LNESLVKNFKAARRASVPLVAVTTPDPAETINRLVESLNGKAKDLPVLVWDIVQGLVARSEAGKAARADMVGDQDSTVGDPRALAVVALKLPAEGLVFMHLANRWLVDPGLVQALWNLRDRLKVDRRMLVLLGPAIDLPPELSGDVVVFDEPLPDGEQLGGIVRSIYSAAKREPETEIMPRAVEALQGLPAFQAEQVAAMSISAKGLDVDNLWERKRRQIEQTPGLKVHRDRVKFADIGGVATVKNFLSRILTGQARPNAVVFVDEIEKFLAGASSSGGDTSGVSQDQLGTLLSYMQDQNAAGCIFVGPPGSAKSMVAKATGNEAGIPTIQLDLGGMKGSLVGQSEQNLRAALKVVTAVSNGRSLWIATCNGISELAPELRRRFTLGTFFFDLPTAAERKVIWELYTKKYQQTAGKKLPADEGWTGAEIKQCCDIAWRLGCGLIEAAKYVVPVSRSAADQLERLRKAADGRFLSASGDGVYSRSVETANVPTTSRGGRQIAVDD